MRLLTHWPLPYRRTRRLEDPIVEAFQRAYRPVVFASFQSLKPATRRKNGQRGAATRLAQGFVKKLGGPHG